MDKNYVRMVMVLGIIGAIVALALANVYKITDPLIQKNRKQTIKEAIKEVLPEAKTYKHKTVKEIDVYIGLDDTGKKVGYAFKSEGPGYQGTISVMAGANKELTKLTGIYVMEQIETPGLGARISEDDFQKSFRKLNIEDIIEYVKNKEPSKDNEIKSITGATISSRSVVDNLNKTIDVLRKALKNG